MNILEIEDLIKGLPDQALMQEAQQPSGRMPQYLVVSEIQRRGDMRKRFQSQQQGQDRGTIAQQILQGGVQEGPAPQAQAPMGQPPAMMPPMGAQRPPMPPQGTPPGPPMGAPQGIAALPQARGIPGPQAAQMAAQAPVRMAEGRQAPSIYDLRRDPFLVNMGLVQPRTEVSAAQMSELDALAGQLGALDSTFAQTREELRATPQATPRQDALGELELGRTPLSRVGETLGDISSEAFRFAAMPGMQAAEAAYSVPYKVGDAIKYLTTPSPTFAELTKGLDPESAFVDIMPRVVSNPSQSAAVQSDASKVVAGGSAAGGVPGAQTEVDPATMEAALQSGDPDAKARQDVGAPRLGGDPTGSYNLGDVSGIGSVGAAQTLLDETTAAVPTFTEEGALESIGTPLAEYQAKRIREAELPGRSYQELIDKVMERSGRDYGEGTAAAAAIRAESEAEQQRLKEEGRSAALSDALIALGAGIAGGDLSGGLSRAGQAATAARKEFETAARQERRYGTLEARAEERAAMAARSAAEAQQLGLMGRQVEADYEANLAKINRDLEADKVLASAAERMGADRRAAEQFLVSTRAKAESLMAQLAQLDQEDRKQAELSSRAISGFLEEIVKADLPAGMQMKSPEEQANYRRQLIRLYVPDLEAVFGRTIDIPPIKGAPIATGGARPDLSAFDR